MAGGGVDLKLHLVVVGQPVGLQLILRPDGGPGGAVGPAVLATARGRGAGRRTKLAPCVVEVGSHQTRVRENHWSRGQRLPRVYRRRLPLWMVR